MCSIVSISLHLLLKLCESFYHEYAGVPSFVESSLSVLEKKLKIKNYIEINKIKADTSKEKLSRALSSG